MTLRDPRLPRAAATVAVVTGTCSLVAAACLAVVLPAPAGAATDSTTLTGQGGTFFIPVMTKLVVDAKPNLGSDLGAYIGNGIDTGISAFAGDSPGSFNADFAVTERPLTSAEASTASVNGRPFAYVPFAATPVAIATLVTNSSYTGQDPVPSSSLCPHVQLTVANVGMIYGLDTAQPLTAWNDSRLSCSNSQPLSAGQTVALAANGDPSMANYALMALMDSDPTAKGFYQAGLSAAFAANLATTQDPTPSEHWPFTGSHFNTAGGDQPFLGKLLNINATTNVPALSPTVLGNTFPVASVWTGVPLGAAWNIPTAAVQNGAGKFVAPSAAAAAAAEADATLAKTNDPTTDNLVTFNASTSDAAAYNNFLMEEEYLVVPTSGLPADKASALAGLIRFVLGPNGQRDITSFGAAPATAAMVTAGLQVAGALDAEAAQAATQSPGSTTTTAPAAAAAAGSASAPGTAAGDTSGSGSGSGSGGSGGGSGSGSPGLAFTGAPDLSILAGAGMVLALGGAVTRRRLRRRGASPAIHSPTGEPTIGPR